MTLRTSPIRVLPVAALALLIACNRDPCPSDTAPIGSQKTGQFICAYQDSNGMVIRHGPFKEWHPNGQRSVEGQYDHGKQVGRWTYWDENGKKTADRQYKDGQLIGEIRS